MGQTYYHNITKKIVDVEDFTDFMEVNFDEADIIATTERGNACLTILTPEDVQGLVNRYNAMMEAEAKDEDFENNYVDLGKDEE